MSEQKELSPIQRAELVGHSLFWYTPTDPSDFRDYIEVVELQVKRWKEAFEKYIDGGKAK